MINLVLVHKTRWSIPDSNKSNVFYVGRKEFPPFSDEEPRAEPAGSQETPGWQSSAKVRCRREGPEEEQVRGTADCLRL